MDNIGAVSGSRGEQYVQQSGNESNTVQGQGFDYDFNPTSEAESSTSWEDGIDELNNSGIADILNDEELKQKTKDEERLASLKASVLNSDGSLNYENIVGFFKSDNFSFEDLAQALGSETNTSVLDLDKSKVVTKSIQLENGEYIIESLHDYLDDDKDKDSLYIGKDVTNEDWGDDENIIWATTGEGKGIDLELYTESNISRKVDVTTPEKTPTTNKFTSQCINDDKTLNLENIGRLVETGEMNAVQFLNAIGYDLKNQDDMKTIGYTRSNTFNFNLPDGTNVSGLTSSWSSSLGEPFIYIQTPDGKEYKFEYGSKK